MGQNLSREEAANKVWRGFWLLLIITVSEVAFALVGNGHVIHGFHLAKFIMVPVMVAASLFKAYYIVKEFMHMGYEVRSFAMTVVLPMFLLVWAIIAFLWEGDTWRSRREVGKETSSVSAPAHTPAHGEGH